MTKLKSCLSQPRNPLPGAVLGYAANVSRSTLRRWVRMGLIELRGHLYVLTLAGWRSL